MKTSPIPGDSLRAWKQTAAGRTYFLYSGSQVVCELDGTGAVMATKTFGPAGPVSRRTASGSAFYAFDAHRSVCQRLSDSGAVLGTQTFDAYGNRPSTDNNSDTNCGYGGQSGYYTDWETGTASAALELLTFRYYDPAAGRFLTRDPVGYKGGANPYEYVDNGPTGKVDPSCLFGEMNWGGAGAGAAGSCLVSIVQNLFPEETDPTGDYRKCKALRDCAADIAGALAGAGIEAALEGTVAAVSAPFIGGCLEGIVSSIGHKWADQSCQKEKPCPKDRKVDDECVLFEGITDAIGACVAGAWLGKESPNILRFRASVIVESIASVVGIVCDQSEEQQH